MPPPARAWLFAFLVLLGGCTDGVASEEGSAAGVDVASLAGTSVVVVLIDTLRPDHLDLYGYEHETAPFLREVGERSIVFEHAFSTSSWTAPATASLFTGLYSDRHGVQRGLHASDELQEHRSLKRFSKGLASLPKAFRARGYRTLGVANNPNIRRDLGFGNGFDEFVGDFRLEADDLLAHVYEWEDELRSEEPFFLYIHMNDVHEPYEIHASGYEPDPSRPEDVTLYDGEIRWVDAELRKLFEHFDFLDRTVVVLTSDHGEEFREHGNTGHTFQIYGELQRVLMAWHLPVPGFVPGRNDSNVSLIDVLPTLGELLDLGDLGRLDGCSLAGELTGGESSPALDARPLFGRRRSKIRDDRSVYSAILGNWKLTDHGRRGIGLFHVEHDPLDQHDRSSAAPERRDLLLDVLHTWLERDASSSGQDVEIEIDPELRRALTELGYVEGS